MAHVSPDLKVLYFGTPVVLISTCNADGSANLAPMSSAWWLGQSCMLGMGNRSKTMENLTRERECVLNLASSDMAPAVDRLAPLTGTDPVPERKAAKGYRFEPDKFGAAGLTRQASAAVRAPRVAECPIQLECVVEQVHPFATGASAVEVRVVRAHVEERLVIPGTDYVDPIGWDPLIMKFCEFFGGAANVHSSLLAAAWRMPHQGMRQVDNVSG
ncbi:flavin reductase family protein [Glycomyces sp. TRM65418]|uniref:flavin reductase family protein n=1 Tax=Glycomyces sp. TRM65418 TaxID=2867006 RepID=UPI001CE5912B|nr:flavin reductase family protein [Glycomyces sp. TRM65418]MCC3762246.1 flavin reductase family protein [Glycomyces sp. TRM65418]QZD56305.1 flavin reductase family protein [Glycomyces sp. TRM65418]